MSNTRKPKGVPSVKEMIKNARLPETTVPICLRADLQVQFEQADRELEDALMRPADSLEGNGSGELARRVEAIRAEMSGSIMEFQLRAMGRTSWKLFLAEHPPRKTEDDKIDERDRYVGVNMSTCFPALIRKSTVSPILDEEDWLGLLGDDEIDGVLTDRQYDTLSNAAWALNRSDVSVPFSPAASRILSNSGSE